MVEMAIGFTILGWAFKKIQMIVENHPQYIYQIAY